MIECAWHSWEEERRGGVSSPWRLFPKDCTILERLCLGIRHLHPEGAELFTSSIASDCSSVSYLITQKCLEIATGASQNQIWKKLLKEKV